MNHPEIVSWTWNPYYPLRGLVPQVVLLDFCAASSVVWRLASGFSTWNYAFSKQGKEPAKGRPLVNGELSWLTLDEPPYVIAFIRYHFQYPLLSLVSTIQFGFSHSHLSLWTLSSILLRSRPFPSSLSFVIYFPELGEIGSLVRTGRTSSRTACWWPIHLLTRNIVCLVESFESIRLCSGAQKLV